VGEVLRLAMLVCLVSASAAHANQRSAELVSSFQIFCTPGPPDFAALDAKATAMNLPVRKDVGAPPKEGQFARAKSWLVSLDSGAHELVASEGRGPNGEVTACGIGADNIDGEEMKQELVKAMKLEAPLRQTASADGTQRLTLWKYGDDVTLLLIDGTPTKIPGMYLTLQRQTNTSR
jgi:hypothetical protein